MSSHNHLLEDAKWDLRQVERKVQRQMRLPDPHLQQLREELPASCLRSLPPRPCCLRPPHSCPWERRALPLLALMDVEGFDPKEVTVTVKDGKVKVSAEHEEEHTTARGKEYNYRNITREISLPPRVSEDEVTYSLEPNSIVKIETVCKCYPCLLRR
nr:PREDICTED: outer dense fiber protein 1 [Balearica regulorum gibbericeps]